MPDDRHQFATIRGRGTAIQPQNPFLSTRQVADLEHVAEDEDYLATFRRPPTVYLTDESQSIVSENDSPDVNFRYSVNPYRGCAHGCSYCYARPTHEYLGFSAGLDFETKVMVKYRAPELLRDWLARSAWEPEPIAFSGVTDCYQPAEQKFELTRGCLQVAAECRQPVGIVTKNALVVRDLDLLTEMANHRLARVVVSITTLDHQLANAMEPRTSTPAARLRTIKKLSSAGVATLVLIAPVIPGINDSEIPAILRAARDAGAQSAAFVLLRLPTTVREIFLDWLYRHQSDRAAKVRALIRLTRGGRLNDSGFGQRMTGSGILAEQIGSTFKLFAHRYGLDQKLEPPDCSAFRPPQATSGQMRMF